MSDTKNEFSMAASSYEGPPHWNQQSKCRRFVKFLVACAFTLMLALPMMGVYHKLNHIESAHHHHHHHHHDQSDDTSVTHRPYGWILAEFSKNKCNVKPTYYHYGNELSACLPFNTSSQGYALRANPVKDWGVCFYGSHKCEDGFTETPLSDTKCSDFNGEDPPKAYIVVPIAGGDVRTLCPSV